MTKRHMKYNPSFLSEAELIESFVVRHADLDLIIRIIGENHTDSNQHVLVIGPRGSGKTTLVHRVAAEIKQDKKFRDRWYPLIFSEESYEVVSAGEFWLEALFHLSEQTNDEKWKQTYDELKDETDDQRLFERALAQLLDFADSQGKRILLIVENFNMLLGDMSSDDEAWKMRHTLMNEQRLMLLATATNRFEQIENSSQAMFEMFKMQELKPLDDDECNRIWESVAGVRLSGERIKPIRILTGGNPRLLTIIAKFGAHRSFRKLLDDLVDLIDDHTEYFKSHLDSLPAIERKVYLALAGLWDASTAREVAKAARLDVNKTSSFLRRLKDRGAVMVEDRGKRIKWYVVAERMYNIYYLMRRRGKPADRVRATVKFMVSMYDPESAARLIAEEAIGLSPEVCRDHYLAYEETIKEVSSRQLLGKIVAFTPKHFLESPYISETLKNIMEVDQEPALKEECSDTEMIGLEEAVKTIEQGTKLFKNGNYEQVIDKSSEVVGKLSDLDSFVPQRILVMALHLKILAFVILDRWEEAIVILDEIIVRFQDSEEKEFLAKVADAMIRKGGALGHLKRFEEAIVIYDEVIRRSGETEESLFLEVVLEAMISKGEALGHLKRFEEAIAIYDEVIRRSGETEEFVLRKLVFDAMIRKGGALKELERTEEAIAVYEKTITAYDEEISCFENSEEMEVWAVVFDAMISKGEALGHLKRFEEAIAIYDEVIRRSGETEESLFLEVVLGAMIRKGGALRQFKRFEEEIAIYDEVLAYLTDSEEFIMRKMKPMVFKTKAFALLLLKKYEEAEKTFRQAIEVEPDDNEVNIALIELLLRIPERPDDALQTAEEIIGRNPQDVHLLNNIAWQFYKHGALSLLPKAEKWSQQAVSLEPEKASAHHILACILIALGNGSEALESAGRYIQNADFVGSAIEGAIELFVELAASGYAKEALGLLVNSPAQKHLEPLVVGLKLYMGEDVKTATEIREVAKDVVKRIEDRLKKR